MVIADIEETRLDTKKINGAIALSCCEFVILHAFGRGDDGNYLMYSTVEIVAIVAYINILSEMQERNTRCNLICSLKWK